MIPYSAYELANERLKDAFMMFRDTCNRTSENIDALVSDEMLADLTKGFCVRVGKGETNAELVKNGFVYTEWKEDDWITLKAPEARQELDTVWFAISLLFDLTKTIYCWEIDSAEASE